MMVWLAALLAASPAGAADSYVLVKANAWLASSPGGSVRARAVEQPGGVLVALRSGDSGGAVQIETITHTDHCYDSVTVGGLSLRLFVDPSDVLPVLTREVTVSDGSDGITLAPGLYAGPGADQVTYGDGVYSLDLPDDAVGDRYSPVLFDGRIGLTGSLSPGTAVSSSSGAIRIDAAGAVGAGVAGDALTIQDRCMVLSLAGQASKVTGSVPTTSRSGVGVAKQLTVSAGAPVTWEDGSSAGTALKMTLLYGTSDEVFVKPGRVCMRYRGWATDLTASQALPLCFDVDDVERVDTDSFDALIETHQLFKRSELPIVKWVDPSPVSAQLPQSEYACKVSVFVDTSGTPTHAFAESCPEVLRSAAEAVALKWKFKAPQHNGSSVQGRVVMMVKIPVR